MRHIGYIKTLATSSPHKYRQSLEHLDHIYRDRCSATEYPRGGWHSVLRTLGCGDHLYTLSLVHLGGSYSHIRQVLTYLLTLGVTIHLTDDDLTLHAHPHPLCLLSLRFLSAITEAEAAWEQERRAGMMWERRFRKRKKRKRRIGS